MNRPSAPLFATINITGTCNLQCGYCFFQPRPRDLMSWEDFRRVVDELANLSVFFVNISGGEPFTHPMVEKFFLYAHEKFQHVVTLTNGTVLLPRHVDAIRSVVEFKGGFPIQVSIDSVNPAINRMTRCDSRAVLRNLRTLKDIGANITIAMVVTQYNYRNLVDSVVRLSEITKFFHLMPFQSVRALGDGNRAFEVPSGELDKLWRRIEEVRAQRGLRVDTPMDDRGAEIGCAEGAPCMAAFSQLVIDPTLRVRPCDRVVDFPVGDLRDSTLAQIWRGRACVEVVSRDRPLCHS